MPELSIADWDDETCDTILHGLATHMTPEQRQNLAAIVRYLSECPSAPSLATMFVDTIMEA